MDETLAELLRKLYGLANYDNLRTAGEVASMTPTPLGDVASGMLAVDDLRQGNYGDAALNAVGLLPFIPAMGGVTKSIGKAIENPKLIELGIDSNLLDSYKKYIEAGRRPNVTTDPYLASTGDKAAHTRAFNKMIKRAEELGLNPNLIYQKLDQIRMYDGMDALK